ncbi:protein RRP5 homolog [Galleria mellonella]|uniref:Protein RRP5 homolog n=1 Tax=Galleria mellonella TaxID=7137 RepID=A0ABM3MZK1_GALME|nr:protein RRP5 homolog [Galleria mellonella]
MADTEEYFPRGGKKPTVTYFKQSGNFLGAAEKGERKKKKPKKNTDADDGYLSDEAAKDFDQSYKNCSSRLTYKTIKQGVLILGRVSQVHETKVTVALPGKMTGTVMACHISEPYNKQLEAYVNDQIDKIRELVEMFRPGQYVMLKVLETEKLMLSMMPQHINSGRSHSDLSKGDLLQAAVVSVEDHGYVMDLGIPNTRPFLPKKHINPEVQLDVGVLAWCCIKSVTISPDNSIVKLSNELSAIQRCTPRPRAALQLLPATPLDFTVQKPLDNGIEGHVLEDTVAYIQRDQVDKVKGKKPALGQKIRARVLYVMPIRKTPFLTMKDIFATTYPNLEEEQILKEGEIVEEAQVIKIMGRSVHFKLGRGCVGAMSLKSIDVDENLSDEDVVAKSYPVGSSHKVRVVSYNLCDYSYTVSDQRSLLSEKYFSLQQLSVGELVRGSVARVADDHVLLSVGRLTGYVPCTHLSDAGMFIDPKKASTSKLPKKKFKEGQELNARVLLLDLEQRKLLLTLKPSLLAPDLSVLKSYEEAEVGKTYTGCIRVIRDYILVTFFNNVTALVPRHYVTKEPIDNLADAFHVGQIVKCTIIRVSAEDKKMTGSFVTAPFTPGQAREKKEKRKIQEEEDVTDEVPNKKRKSTDDQIELAEVKKKKKKPEQNAKEVVKEQKQKKKDKGKESGNESASDHIETDVNDEDGNDTETNANYELEVTFNNQEHELMDLSNCNDEKKCKKRTVSLLKLIKARDKRIQRIEEKIANIEKKGLNAKNKVYHTAMHADILLVQERKNKLLESLKCVQERLKEFKKNDAVEQNKKVDGKKADNKTNSDDNKEKKKRKKKKEVKEDKKQKYTELQVVGNLEPVLESPSAKDFWSTPTTNVTNEVQEDEDLSSSDDEQKEQPKKKRKKLTVAEKLAKVREEEERVREMERRAIESEAQPRSSDQFERALLASPDCSQLWIAYMAFHLQATEIEKARAVGRKALSTISFREEREKLNVWIAMLNLEHRFGTQESQQKTLEDALQMNEPFTVHSKLLDIYVETSKQQELVSLVDLMMRKYKRQPDAYTQAGGACFKLGLVDKARQVMQKAIGVLEKKEHVSVLVQFALLERSSGSRERAEALFEQVLAVYPQRVDVVSAYVDMLLKGGDVDQARQVMDRMTSQKIPARKMKTLYKKWIEVEEKIGDQEQIDRIRQRAMEYIEKAQF